MAPLTNYFYLWKIGTLNLRAGASSAGSYAQSLPRLLRPGLHIHVTAQDCEDSFHKLNTQKPQTSLSEFVKVSGSDLFPFLVHGYLEIDDKDLQWQ